MLPTIVSLEGIVWEYLSHKLVVCCNVFGTLQYVGVQNRRLPNNDFLKNEAALRRVKTVQYKSGVTFCSGWLAA